MTQPSMRPPFPPPQPLRMPYPQPPRRSVVPLVAGLFGVIAAGLTLGGSFAPIHQVENGPNGYTLKWWGLERAEVGQDVDGLAGLTLVLATLLLGVGAVLAFNRTATAARLFLALGVGSLTGTVALQLNNTLNDLKVWNNIPLEPGETVRFTTGWGLWLPLSAVVFGVVAVVLSYRGGSARVEPSTPRMGFPMPYGPPTGTQPPVPGATTPPGAVPVAAGVMPGTVPTGMAGAVPPPLAAPPVAPVAPPVAAPAPVVPPPVAPPATSDDPDVTLRTTVSEAPAEAPAPAAPGASAAAAMVPEPPAAMEIANALTPTQVAPDAPTEIPPSDAAEWTAADVDAPPEPAADAPTEVPQRDPATEPAPLDSAPDVAEPEPAATATEAEAATEAEETSEPEATTADQPAPEPGASGLSGLPAAPPAPELAGEQKES